jgi:hypothetical protein
MEDTNNRVNNTDINESTFAPEFKERMWKTGQSGNPNGRPKGTRNYATIMREAFRKVGETKGITADDIEIELIKSAYKHAMAGNYRFFAYITSSLYGPIPKTPPTFTEQHDDYIIED